MGDDPAPADVAVAVSRSWAGRRVLVTGGSRGLGAAIVRALGARGAFVVIGCRAAVEQAEGTLAAVRAAGGDGMVVRANLVHPDEVRVLAAAALAGGPLDALVHAAALGAFKPLLATRANQWQLTTDTDARGFLLLVQALAELGPAGLRDGARIVALSSPGAERVVAAYGAIGVAKAALEATVRALAVELGGRRITVNAVVPGLVADTSVAAHPAYAELAAAVAARTPLGRLATAADVVPVVLALLSGELAFVTGQRLLVDGGAGLGL